VSLPAWIPGSYLIREFARHLQPLQATQGRTACACVQIDKASWDIECDPRRPLVLRYEVYAFDNSVRTAWLDASRGFFNGTSLCLRVHGHEDASRMHSTVASTVRPPPTGQLATGLTPQSIVNAQGFGVYRPPLRRTGGVELGTLLERAIHRLRRGPPLRGGGCRAIV
jgi:predicted metalloprotease with PDZ domain